MVLAWENLQKVFVILVVIIVLFHWRIFFLHCFSTSFLILPWTIARFFHPFYTFSPAHCRVIRGTFISAFWAFPSQPYRECHGFDWAFFTPRLFLLCPISHILARFVTQMLAGAPHPGSSSVPALTKLSFPADAWSWTTDVVDRRPLVYQLHQWATTYKVTKLLNMFQPTYGCSKSYGKDYKQDLLRNIAWNCFNETTTSKLFKKAATPFVCSKQAAIIENNQCLMDKRCFWDLVIFLI